MCNSLCHDIVCMMGSITNIIKTSIVNNTLHLVLISPRRGPWLPKPTSTSCSTENSGVRTGLRCFFAGKSDLPRWARREKSLFQNGDLARQMNFGHYMLSKKGCLAPTLSTRGAPQGPCYTILKVYLRSFTNVQFWW